MPPPRFLLLALLVCAIGLGAAACGGGDGPSVRAQSDDTTTTTTSTTVPTTTDSSTTTTTTAPAPTTPGQGRELTYNGLRFTVPTDWPVHDLAAERRTCVKADVHAVFLGPAGSNPDCPATVIGHTDTIQVEPVGSAGPADVARATQATTVNGLQAKVDPNPDANGQLTVVFPDQGVAAIITYGSRTVADSILASFQPA